MKFRSVRYCKTCKANKNHYYTMKFHKRLTLYTFTCYTCGTTFTEVA